MTMKQEAIEFVLENRELVFAILSGLIAALGHWKKTGRLPLGRLPLRALRKSWREISTKYLRVSRPRDAPALIVYETVEDIERKLRPVHFESGDLYSYEYSGEALNLRRPEGIFETKDGEKIPSELHGRWFKTADGRLLCLAHHEASRFEAWKAHLDESMFSWKRGQESMAGVFDGRGIKYERIESEKDSGVEVVDP